MRTKAHSFHSYRNRDKENIMAKADKKEQSKQLSVPDRNWMPASFDDMERWFEDFFRRPLFPGMPIPRFAPLAREAIVPSIDVFEKENEVVVKAELPGISKDDLEVSVTENRVTISGEKKAEEQVEKKDFYRLERSYGSFSRTVRLPTETVAEQAKASFNDGVLEIRIPKTKEAKEKVRKIEIE